MSSHARVYAIDGADPESFDREFGVGGLSSSDNVFFYALAISNGGHKVSTSSVGPVYTYVLYI